MALALTRLLVAGDGRQRGSRGRRREEDGVIVDDGVGRRDGVGIAGGGGILVIGPADVTIARPTRTAGQQSVAVETHRAFLAMET